MKLSNLMIINAIVALVYGIAFVLVPTTVLGLYGMTQGTSEALAGQFFGVTLIAIGLLTWFARKVTDSDAQRAIILSLLISDVIGVIVAVMGTVSGVMNSFGWSAVVIYLLLALGYAYFQFFKPSAS
jgi:NAD/NADP transhydrogenase beta subunit